MARNAATGSAPGTAEPGLDSWEQMAHADLGEVPRVDELAAELARELPIFEPLLAVAPPASFRIEGMRIARQPHRYSGRTAMHAGDSVFEPKPPDDPESPLAFSMEGYQGQAPSSLLPRFWAPGWNSDQALARLQQGVDQPLPGGDPGRRLVEPADVASTPAFFEPPEAFAPARGEHLVVPLHHIFGSEELSAHAPGIASCAPRPFLGLGPEGAAALGLSEGGAVLLEVDGRELSLPVEILPALAPGVAALPVGLPGLEGVFPPFSARLRTMGPSADAEGLSRV